MDIKNKTAIVTGSGSGIGRALAIEFAKQQANVVCTARREDKINETVQIIRQAGGNAVAVKADVTVAEDVQKVVSAALETYGQIDVLFNNAGSFNALGAIWEVDPAEWWHDVTVNMLGPMLFMHAVLPHMMKRDTGIIINMNGGGATVPLNGGSGYGSSKAGLLRMTDTLAVELEKTGSSVLVFAMGPGFVKTEMTMLQIENPMGVKWIPSSKEAMDAGLTSPPEACAEATMQLIQIACPELSGRIFGVGTDFEDVKRRAKEIKEKDLFVMRGV